MGGKKLASMSIAIIGDTAIAESYASEFARNGHDIYLASCGRNNRKPKDFPAYDGEIYHCTITEAASCSDFVILATEPKNVREAAYWLEDVRRKVIIDATANVPADEKELVPTVCAIKSITGSPHVIKVFNTHGYEKLLNPLFCGHVSQLLVLSDSLKAREITRIMMSEIGITSLYDMGGSEHIPLFNEMTKCWRKLANVEALNNLSNTLPDMAE